LRRGQHHITVVHDLDAKRLLFATVGRDHQTVLDFAADLKAHRRGVARCCDAAAVGLETCTAIQASIDSRSGRAGYPIQPASCADFFDEFDDTDRPGLLAQDIDGLLNAQLLLGRQPRGQWLPSSIAVRNGRGFVDLAQARSVAIDRRPVNAGPLGQTLGTGPSHRLVA